MAAPLGRGPRAALVAVAAALLLAPLIGTASEADDGPSYPAPASAEVIPGAWVVLLNDASPASAVQAVSDTLQRRNPSVTVTHRFVDFCYVLAKGTGLVPAHSAQHDHARRVFVS